MDELSLREFESIQTALVISPGCWKAIQVFEGSEAINETGIVATLSSPLTSAGITMMYLSTFKTDLILVPENKIDEAVECLHAKLASCKQEQVQQQQQPSVQITSSPTATAKNNNNKTPTHTLPDDTQIIVTPLSDRLCIAVFKSAELMTETTHPLLRQFFFPERSDRFFSFTATPTETTMIIDEQSLRSFPVSSLEVHLESWRAIQVLGEGSMGFSQMHVAALSQLLAREGISIYYLSTFNTDFVLVHEHKLADALKCLQTSLNVLTETR